MEQIGFIGLGIMGKPMVRNLAKAGYSVVVHNRSQEAVDELTAELGAVVAASSPREVAERTKTVITMLPDSSDVRAVVFGHVHAGHPGLRGERHPSGEPQLARMPLPQAVS